MTQDDIEKYKRRLRREQERADAAALADGGAAIFERKQRALAKTAQILSSKPREELTNGARKKLEHLRKLGMFDDGADVPLDAAKAKRKI